MSFSSTTKNELCQIRGEDRCCQIAELSALIKISGSIGYSRGKGLSLTLTTENPAIARRIFTSFKRIFGMSAEILIKQNRMLKKANTYMIVVQGAEEILKTLKIIEASEGNFRFENGIPEGIENKECCIRAYLRGVFLGGGSLSDPEKGYHLEIVANDEPYALALTRMMGHYDLTPHIILRKNHWVVYVKEGDQIVDFLNVIGAHTILLEFENIRILKQMRNDVNRLVNCETANLNKTVESSYHQMEDIEYIRDRVGLDYLSDQLREVAQIRLENREATLKEIGELMDPPLGKSGINHRFRKIEKIAAEFRERLEEAPKQGAKAEVSETSEILEQ
ncbi:MAG: DNA-binding protein WhiA [Erysipelotrichaceae bacterium]|nr:DNA-binding protein WhiA [Erysipelotrichaceae bacterium]